MGRVLRSIHSEPGLTVAVVVHLTGNLKQVQRKAPASALQQQDGIISAGFSPCVFTSCRAAAIVTGILPGMCSPAPGLEIFTQGVVAPCKLCHRVTIAMLACSTPPTGGVLQLLPGISAGCPCTRQGIGIT